MDKRNTEHDTEGNDVALPREIVARLGGRSVVFVGMMGSGKSAIGRLLAARLNLPYFDSDHEIAAAAGMSIREIFEQFGEDYFRRGEQRVIERLVDGGPAVISLGGGAFVNPATRELLAGRAVTIWLTADLDLLHSRVMRRPGTRPLLESGDPREILAELMEKRNPIYEKADVAVASSRHSKKKTCDEALAALKDFLNNVERPVPGSGEN